MNTKSAIQVIAETLVARESFQRHLEEIVEKYDVKNNVFACDADGLAENLKTGYYGEVETYESLDEAIKNCNVLLQGIRIHEGKYSVGNLYTKLSAVKEDYIIDLAKSQVI